MSKLRTCMGAYLAPMQRGSRHEHAAPTSNEPAHDAVLRAGPAPRARCTTLAPPPALSAGHPDASARAGHREPAAGTAMPRARATRRLRTSAPWHWLARPSVAAGFAGVMVATLVGVMWWDQPLDEAMPRARRTCAGPTPTAADAPPTALPSRSGTAAPPAPRRRDDAAAPRRTTPRRATPRRRRAAPEPTPAAASARADASAEAAGKAPARRVRAAADRAGTGRGRRRASPRHGRAATRRDAAEAPRAGGTPAPAAALSADGTRRAPMPRRAAPHAAAPPSRRHAGADAAAAPDAPRAAQRCAPIAASPRAGPGSAATRSAALDGRRDAQRGCCASSSAPALRPRWPARQRRDRRPLGRELRLLRDGQRAARLRTRRRGVLRWPSAQRPIRWRRRELGRRCARAATSAAP